jgi:hypothetical protein
MRSIILKAKSGIGTIFATFLGIILGLSLTSSVADTVNQTLFRNASGTGVSNVTGTGALILPLITIMWIFLVLGVGAIAVYVQMKAMDMIVLNIFEVWILRAKAGIGTIFATFLGIILGLSLTGTVADTVAGAVGGNVTGTSATLLPLVTVMWIFLVLGIGAGAVYVQFKKMDIILWAKAGIGTIFATFLGIILGLSLTGTVADTVAGAVGGNVTGTSATLLPLVTVMWIFLVLGIGAGAVYVQFKKMD